MSRSPRRPDPLRDFMRAVQHFGRGQHQPWRIFADFCELSALALAQVPLKDPEREARYLKIIKGYEPGEAATFGNMLGMVVQGLEEEPCDFLGNAFQQLELSNHWHGQFFTPPAIARLMAELTFDGDDLVEREFITVNDPACGAGVALLATAQAVLARGINPQERLHATGQDIDPTAAHMAYVQLALSGIPATVIVGNTLTLETREVWHTPAHHLGFWDVKLRRRAARPIEVAAPPPVADRRGQYALPLGEQAA